MADVLAQLEQTRVAVWIHEGSTIYSYPLILFFHTLGMGLLVGLSSAIDLRILGVAPGIPLAPIRRLYPLMWVGFAINLVTGSLLFISDATKHFSNPAFFVKLTCVALAVLTMIMIKSRVLGDPPLDKRPLPMTHRLLALSSIVFWLVAITAGRLMAYIAEFLANRA